MPVKDVEDAVKSDNDSFGIEIVRSGRTARGKGLYVYGEPLFLSESLLVADYGRYQRSEKLQSVVEAFNPLGFFDRERIENFGQWYKSLSGNLGENWVDRPDATTMFEGSNPISSLRPYTLRSRGWVPSDEMPAIKQLSERLTLDLLVSAGLRNSRLR